MISLTDPTVQTYLFYSAILAAKLIFVTILTANIRMSKKIFANEEDAKSQNGVVKLNDPDIERVRRAHMNDLENIPVFWVICALYLTTNPSPMWAQMLIRMFTAGRIIHTYVYTMKPSQPARGMAFGISYLVNCYMIFNVIIHYIGAW